MKLTLNAKQTTRNNRTARTGIVLGLTTLMAGTVLMASPAHADDGRDHRDRAAVRYDAAALRRDRDHLRDLERRRADFAAHHNWAAVRQVDAAIANTRWRTEHQQYNLNHDFDRFYSDRDREWFYHHR